MEYDYISMGVGLLFGFVITYIISLAIYDSLEKKYKNLINAIKKCSEKTKDELVRKIIMEEEYEI